MVIVCVSRHEVHILKFYVFLKILKRFYKTIKIVNIWKNR